MSGRVLIIGAGLNGLTAAGLLAKAGREVLVLEARDTPGGLASPEAFHEGFTAPGLLHDTARVRPWVASALSLASHGLSFRDKAPAVWAPTRGGGGLTIDGASLAGDFQAGDDARWAELHAFITRTGPIVDRLMDRPAPDPMGPPWPLLGTGLAVRRLGADAMVELLRLGPMCVADWMRDTLSTERLRAAVALPALEASFTGPWSAGSAANLIFQRAPARAEVAGGPPALARALTAAAAAQGATVRTQARVQRILVGDQGVEGVELAGGERLDATTVLATCDPRQTFLRLVDPARLATAFVKEVGNIRARGTTAIVRLALSAPLTDGAGRPAEVIRTGDTLDDLERAFDAAKYRELPERPVLDIRQPTVADPALAPAGQHVATILAHAAPYNLKGGWTEGAHELLGDRVIAALAEVCPGAEATILGRQILSPEDLQTGYGLDQGHLHHGEHALDQLLFMRPTKACADHSTPLPGLWLGGAGCHPGGGLTCAPGGLAARALLAARRAER